MSVNGECECLMYTSITLTKKTNRVNYERNVQWRISIFDEMTADLWSLPSTFLSFFSGGGGELCVCVCVWAMFWNGFRRWLGCCELMIEVKHAPYIIHNDNWWCFLDCELNIFQCWSKTDSHIQMFRLIWRYSQLYYDCSLHKCYRRPHFPRSVFDFAGEK